MRPCFQFTNLAAADGKPAVLQVYEEIGFWGLQAKDFINQLGQVQGNNLELEISSPGGDVFAALAMYNALRASGKTITAKVMGIAASAASFLMLAGDKRIMPKNTMVMTHLPMTGMYGNANEFREAASVLDKITAQLSPIYTGRTGMSDEKVAEILAQDTYISADEALTLGFATEVTEEVKATAKFDMNRAGLPDHVKALFAAKGEPVVDPVVPTPEITPVPEPVVEPPAEPFADQVTALAKADGFEAHAPTWVVNFTKLPDVQAAIATAREIRAICAAVGKPDQASGFITAKKNLADVRAALIEAMARDDEKAPVSQTKPSNQPTQNASQSAVSTADIWAKRKSVT